MYICKYTVRKIILSGIRAYGIFCSIIYSKLRKTATSTTAANATGSSASAGNTKSPTEATSSNQLKIDTLLNKKDTNIHVIKPHPTAAIASDNAKTPDVLLSSDTAAVSPLEDASNDQVLCHEQSCHTNNSSHGDMLDCLFDDIDYHDLFDLEPLPLVTEDNIKTPRQQEHKGSCDLDELSCDAIELDNTIVEIPASDDEDVFSDMSTVSCSKF